MPNHYFHYQKPAGPPPSACLSRSRSERPATLPPELHHTNKPSPGPMLPQRSKSTTKSRTKKGEENKKPSSTSPRIPKKHQENKDHSVTLLQNGQVPNNIGHVVKRTRHGPSSPSAWALSPGRSLPALSHAVPKSPSYGNLNVEVGGGGGGSGWGSGGGGVLKYFRRRKVPMVQEEVHWLRILHNRLLQWRFVNARGQASMAAMKLVGEKKLFSVWLRTIMLRRSIVEKRIQTQRLMQEIKLYEIINPQICLIKEWSCLENKNSEAIGRLIRRLSAISIRLPLIHGAKADDVLSVYHAMKSAMGFMDSLESVATKFLPQVEKICFLTTEVVIMEKQYRECMGELEKWISTVTSLQAKERSLRVHLAQVAVEVKRAKRLRTNRQEDIC